MNTVLSNWPLESYTNLQGHRGFRRMPSSLTGHVISTGTITEHNLVFTRPLKGFTNNTAALFSFKILRHGEHLLHTLIAISTFICQMSVFFTYFSIELLAWHVRTLYITFSHYLQDGYVLNKVWVRRVNQGLLEGKSVFQWFWNAACGIPVQWVHTVNHADIKWPSIKSE